MDSPITCRGSSLLHSFRYDRGERLLRVYFRNGYVYDYFFVPEEVAVEFQQLAESGSESIGKWFTKNVKKTFEYQRVEGESTNGE
ncbi:MAG: KTSC domain-containing protein [Spirochaetes bacterium]|nr:MAG: KTSC domain-containing protein [Spirochaetota bacterium]